jgi:murein DD-endopeptidase MepM/ murein hydrolase activator NlpD
MVLDCVLRVILTAATFVQQDIRWTPHAPLEGSLLRIHADTALTGELAGEPLHFLADSAGEYTALAAVPLGSPDTTALVVRRGIGGAPVIRGVPVRPRPSGPVARLRTAPEFTRPPDAALSARLRRERQLVATVLRATHQRPRLWSEPFVTPRPGSIRSPFGATRGFTEEGDESRHRGADLTGERGAPVRAANRGVVALVADLFYAGTVIYVDHGAGLITAYAHLSRALVTEGDTVARGALIGRVGATGRVTGPHLHWTALYGRVAFDPEDLLRIERGAP